MHREHRLDVGKFLDKLLERLIDVAHRLAEILTPMRRHEHDAPPPATEAVEQRIIEGKILPHRLPQGVDDRIARDEDAAFIHALAQKVRLCRHRRRKMEVGDRSRELAVHLLRKRRILVLRAKPRLHMADCRLMIVSRQSACKRRRRVAMHEHDIGLLLRENTIESKKSLRRDVEERLALRHDVEIVVGRDRKERKHLVEHLAVLRRHSDERRYLCLMLLEFEHDRRHLDRFGARAENRHDLDLLHRFVLLFPHWNERVESMAETPPRINASGRNRSCGRYRASSRRRARRRRRRRR